MEKLNKLYEKVCKEFKSGITVHTPGGVAKVISVDGDKVNVRMIDGGVDQQYNINDIQSESVTPNNFDDIFSKYKIYDLLLSLGLKPSGNMSRDRKAIEVKLNDLDYKGKKRFQKYFGYKESFKKEKNYKLEQTLDSMYFIKQKYDLIISRKNEDEQVKALKDSARLIRKSCNIIEGNL